MFCYIGQKHPGSDTITAYADSDADNTQDVGEPTSAATKNWVKDKDKDKDKDKEKH
jgi:hypothetical protein